MQSEEENLKLHRVRQGSGHANLKFAAELLLSFLAEAFDEARISSADCVHRYGLGYSLCRSMNVRISFGHFQQPIFCAGEFVATRLSDSVSAERWRLLFLRHARSTCDMPSKTSAPQRELT